jgi:hypothetical protein
LFYFIYKAPTQPVEFADDDHLTCLRIQTDQSQV